jgi:hypothetical protein
VGPWAIHKNPLLHRPETAKVLTLDFFFSFKGGSFGLGAGIDAPGTELGASAGIVWSIPNGDLIGGTYGLGLAGVGLSPIEISVDKCFTNDLFYL